MKPRTTTDGATPPALADSEGAESEVRRQEEREQQEHERDTAFVELETAPFATLPHVLPPVAVRGDAPAFGGEGASRESEHENPGPGATGAGAGAHMSEAARVNRSQAPRSGKPRARAIVTTSRFSWAAVVEAQIHGIGSGPDLVRGPFFSWSGREPRTPTERAEYDAWAIHVYQRFADESGMLTLYAGDVMAVCQPGRSPRITAVYDPERDLWRDVAQRSDDTQGGGKA